MASQGGARKSVLIWSPHAPITVPPGCTVVVRPAERRGCVTRAWDHITDRYRKVRVSDYALQVWTLWFQSGEPSGKEMAEGTDILIYLYLFYSMENSSSGKTSSPTVENTSSYKVSRLLICGKNSPTAAPSSVVV